MRVSASCTCFLSALPAPVTACLTSFGAYSATGRPASAATRMIAPVARATCKALTWLRLQATRSTATAAGRCSAMAARAASAINRNRTLSSASAGVMTVVANRRSLVRPRRPTTARPHRATPGSTPRTELSNICSPQSRPEGWSGQRPSGPRGYVSVPVPHRRRHHLGRQGRGLERGAIRLVAEERQLVPFLLLLESLVGGRDQVAHVEDCPVPLAPGPCDT